ncbi:hypothetical protein D3C81_1695010 [compost metagenome]
MREFIDQDQGRLACQRRIDIEFSNGFVAIGDILARQDFQPVQQGCGFLAAVGFHQADDDIQLFRLHAARGVQHRVSLADPGRSAKIDAQLAARRTPVLRLHLRQQGVGIRALVFAGWHEFYSWNSALIVTHSGAAYTAPEPTASSMIQR